MKNKNIFLKIYIILFIISVITLTVLSILGSKPRVGYLYSFSINTDKTLIENNLYNKDINNIKGKELVNYILTNKNISVYIYDFSIGFYDKFFRSSDIYGIYPDFSNIKSNFNDISTYGAGERYSYLKSDHTIPENTIIDNIKYTLKIKLVYYITLILSLIVVLIILNKDRIFSYINNLYIRKIKIKISSLIIYSYLYLIIPYLIFILTWTKYSISIPTSILLLILLYLIIKDTLKNNEAYYDINIFILILISLLIFFIIIISGIGEIFPQNIDMRLVRNAVFRDLVNFSWPIIYPESGYGFVYYFAHWVLPAIFGKIFGFTFAKIVLILWTYIGIFLSYLLILSFLKINKNTNIIISLIIFILYTGIKPYAGDIRIDYTPMHQQISFIFNQAIAIWLMSALFLHQKNSSNFAFLGLSVVFYSPYAILGILPYMIVKVILDIKENRVKELKNIFSIRNILASITIFPILFLYLSSSATTDAGFHLLIKEHNYLKLFINTMFGFGLFAIFLYKNNRNNYIFYVSIFIFIIVSMIKYHQDHNFSRVNLSAIFFFAIFTIDYFNNSFNLKDWHSKIFLILIIFASFQSIFFFEKQIGVFIEGKIAGRETDIGYNTTYNVSVNTRVLSTLTCQDVNNSLFFKYIAKDNNK